MTPLLLLAALQIPALPVQAKLGPAGEIETWLVAKEPKSAYGVEGTEWKFGYAPPKTGLNLRDLLGGDKPDNTWGLAATTLVSLKAQRATLLFGTDDGGTLTLNGKEIWRNPVLRGMTRDDERVTLDLRKGENTLVFRVDQADRDWGLVARLEGAPGQNLAGVESRVDLLMEGDHPEIRMARDLGPGFDADAAVLYVETYRRVRIWDKYLGGGKVFKGLALSFPGGFGDANALNAHFADHAAKIRRAYDRERAPMLAKAQNPGPLYPDVKAEIGIRVMSGGRQFMDASGKAFVPIGYNHNPDWTEFGHANPMAEEYDPKRADAWCAKLQRNGVNLLRMMVETPPSGDLEDPIGVFSPEHMIWLDTVVRAARDHGIRLMLTPYDTFWMNLRADTSPYWKANGGPLDPARKSEWYTNPKIREAQKRRNHWLIDRYGNLDTVFCWEPMNEADIWWDATPAQLQNWADDIVADAKAYQRKRWGTDRLFSISTANSMPAGDLGAFAYRRPDLDLANTHLYIGAARKAPKNASDVIAPEAEGVRHALEEMRDNRPYIDTENGPIDGWIADERLDNAVFHDQSWSHLASGGAGSGLRWPYRNPHHLTDGMLASLKTMRRFADAVNWSKLTGKTIPMETVSYGAITTGYRTPTGAILFAARPPDLGLAPPLPVTIPNAPKGTPRLYDTEKGVWIEAKREADGGVTIPPGVRSICAVWTY